MARTVAMKCSRVGMQRCSQGRVLTQKYCCVCSTDKVTIVQISTLQQQDVGHYVCLQIPAAKEQWNWDRS